MNLLWFLLVGVIIFFSLLLGGRRYRGTALYALAIGGIVNANFFHAGNYPINIFGLDFGIDSIIYTLFVFCVIVMYIEEGKKQAYILMFSGVIAIVFSALMQLLSSLLSDGSSVLVWTTFAGFMISALAGIVAITVMLELLHRIKLKNEYVGIVIGILVASVLNSGIYYPLSMLVNGMPTDIWTLLLTSFIGKLLAMLLAVLTFGALRKADRRRSSGGKHRHTEDA